MKQPKHYVLILAPEQVQVVLNGVAKLTIEKGMATFLDVQKQAEEQLASANKPAESVAPAAQ